MIVVPRGVVVAPRRAPREPAKFDGSARRRHVTSSCSVKWSSPYVEINSVMRSAWFSEISIPMLSRNLWNSLKSIVRVVLFGFIRWKARLILPASDRLFSRPMAADENISKVMASDEGTGGL